MAEHPFDDGVPWGEDGQFIVAHGHIDLAEFLARAEAIYDEYIGGWSWAEMCEEGLAPQHGYATRTKFPHPDYDLDWWWFHTDSVDGSVPITILDLQGGSLQAIPPEGWGFDPEVEPEPELDTPDDLDGRLVEHVRGEDR